MKSYGLSQLTNGLSDGLLCIREEVHKALLGPQSSSHVYKEGFYGGGVVVVEGVKAKILCLIWIHFLCNQK